MIEKAISLLITAIIAYLVLKIPFINRLVKRIWKRHKNIIIAVVVALFFALFVMPQLMK